MQNASTVRERRCGDCWNERGASILALPYRLRPPKTLSQIIARYKALRAPRGAYWTPMPGDLAEAMR